LDFELKEFWKIDGRNHIYTSLGGQIQDDDLVSRSFQLLENGQINSFDTSGFDNDLRLNFYDIYVGLQYQLRWHKTSIKPGLFAHQLKWNFKRGFLSYRKTNLLLPTLQIKTKVNYKSNLNLDYRLKTGFLTLTDFAKNYFIEDIHSIVRGNSEMNYELFHEVKLNYDYFKFSSGTIGYAFLQYIQKIQSKHQSVTLSDLNVITIPNISFTPENNLNFVTYYKKDFDNFFIEFNTIFSYFDTYQTINENQLDIKNMVQYYKFSLGSFSKKVDEFKIGFSYKITNIFQSNKNTYKHIAPYIQFDVPYHSFRLKGNYIFNYLNYNSSNNYQQAALSLLYHRENRAFSFEISAQNIFNTTIRENLIFNDYYYATQTTYQQPILLLFKIMYQL